MLFRSLRLGVPREIFFNETLSGNSPEINIAVKRASFQPQAPAIRADFEPRSAAIKKIASLGAHVQDPADLPSAQEFLTSNNETIVLDTDFKVDLAAYLAELSNATVLTLEDVINFNDKNRALEFADGECCQETLVRSVMTTGKETELYKDARAADLDIGRTRGIGALTWLISTEDCTLTKNPLSDSVLKKYNLEIGRAHV